MTPEVVLDRGEAVSADVLREQRGERAERDRVGVQVQDSVDVWQESRKIQSRVHSAGARTVKGQVDVRCDHETDVMPPGGLTH